jgi:hypothetical protein
VNRGDKVKCSVLQIGSRFHKTGDRKKVFQVHEIIIHPHKTSFDLLCVADECNPKYPVKINSTLEVIFLRNSNTQNNPQTN